MNKISKVYFLFWSIEHEAFVLRRKGECLPDEDLINLITQLHEIQISLMSLNRQLPVLDAERIAPAKE